MYKAIAAAGVAAVFGLGLSAQAADLGDGSFKDAPVVYGPGPPEVRCIGEQAGARGSREQIRVVTAYFRDSS